MKRQNVHESLILRHHQYAVGIMQRWFGQEKAVYRAAMLSGLFRDAIGILSRNGLQRGRLFTTATLYGILGRNAVRIIQHCMGVSSQDGPRAQRMWSVWDQNMRPLNGHHAGVSPEERKITTTWYPLHEILFVKRRPS